MNTCELPQAIHSKLLMGRLRAIFVRYAEPILQVFILNSLKSFIFIHFVEVTLSFLLEYLWVPTNFNPLRTVGL